MVLDCIALLHVSHFDLSWLWIDVLCSLPQAIKVSGHIDMILQAALSGGRGARGGRSIGVRQVLFYDGNVQVSSVHPYHKATALS